MNITEVIVKKPRNADKRIIANVCLVLDGELRLNGLRLVQGNGVRPFVVYPGESYRIRGKTHHFNHIFPMTTELHNKIMDAVNKAATEAGLLPEEVVE